MEGINFIIYHYLVHLMHNYEFTNIFHNSNLTYFKSFVVNIKIYWLCVTRIKRKRKKEKFTNLTNTKVKTKTSMSVTSTNIIKVM